MLKVRKILYESAYARTLGLVVITIVGGILTNWLISDLNVDGKGVQWSALIQTPSTFWLGGFIFALCIYTYGQFRFDKELLRWNDPEFVRATMRATLIPALLESEKERINKGERRGLADLEKELLGP